MKFCPTCHRTYADDDAFCSYDRAALTTDPLVGVVLGSFRVDAWLAEGGLGVVYKAEHVEIHRPAAVKVVKKEFVTDQTVVARFLQEARTVSKIRHPNLIDIFDIGTTPDGRVYYVMELLEGRSLADRMRQGPLPLSEFGPILVETLDALETAHAMGIVHRDLKPENLFLVERPGEQRYVKVLDFGVAKVLGGDEDVQSRLTRTGMIVGTPQYMAPEQIDGSPVDLRADLYAIGVILYELSTGALPFRAQTVGGLLKAHMMESPARFEPSRLSPGVPAALEAIVFKSLAKTPGDRYASAREVRDDLERVMAGKEPRATQSRNTAATMIASPNLPGIGARPSSGSYPVHPSVPPQPVTPVGAEPSLAPQPSTEMLPQPAPMPTPAPMQAPTAAKSKLPILVGGALAVVVAGAVAVLWPRGEKPSAKPTLAAREENAAPQKKSGPNLSALRSRALEVITKGLRDGDPEMRRLSLDALASDRDPRHGTLVEPLLADADKNVQLAATRALETLGARKSIPALRAAQSSAPKGHYAFALAMMRLGDPSAEKLFRDLFKSGKTRTGAAHALAAVDKSAREVLLKEKSDRRDVLIKLAPFEERARDELAGVLGAGRDSIPAAEALARAGDARGKETLQKLSHSADEAEQLLAYRALAGVDDQSGYEKFLAVFSDGNHPMYARVVAAQGLGLSGEKGALDRLAPALDDQEASLRIAAAGAVLAIVGADPKMLAARSLDWASAALNDDSWAVREQAAAVLADADAELAVPLLGKALDDKQPEVRRTAVASLGKTRAAAAVPLLGKALDDQKEDVRVGAIRSMGKIGHKSAQPILTRHLEKAPKMEKVVAAGQLARLGDKSHMKEVKDALSSAEPAMRKLAVEESAADPGTQKDAMQTALKDKNFGVRLAAAMQLADGGSRDGISVLQEGVKRGGPDGLRAWSALKKLGVEPTAALDPTLLLDNKDRLVRLQAIDAAGSLEPAKAADFYQRALGDPDALVRLAALDSAAARGAWATAIVKRALSTDVDAAVRAKAAALLSKIVPPEEREAPKPAAPETPVETPPSPSPEAIAAALPDLAVAPPDLAQVVVTREEASKEEAHLAMTAGEIALKGGRIEVALRELTRAHKLDARLPINFSLGEVYRKLGDREVDKKKQRDAYAKAIAYYKKSPDKRAASYAAELQDRLK